MEWCYITLLQAYFEQRVIELVKELPSAKRTVLWEDNSKGHTSGLPKDAVVELWKEHHGDSTVRITTANWIIIAQILRFSYCFKLPLLRVIFNRDWAIVLQFVLLSLPLPCIPAVLRIHIQHVASSS